MRDLPGLPVWRVGRWLRRLNPYVADTLIALLVQAAVTMPFVVPRPPGLPAVTWQAYALTSLTALPLIWRRRAPFTVLLVIATCHSANTFLDWPGQPLPYGALVAIYTIAAQSPARHRIAVIALTVPGTLLGVAFNTNSAREHLFTFFVFFGAYVLGRLSYTRQEYTTAIEDRALRLEREREMEAERAAERERARIAREMHDILSHAVSLMIVQAEAGPVAVRAAPERAEAAFDAIASAGRDAMVQLRRMLGVLKESESAGSRAPQPTVESIPRLVDQVRDTGIDTQLEVTGSPRPLPPDSQVTVYRVIQEALTNVIKHAAASRVVVRLDWTGDALAVSVTDDGGGVRPGAGGGHGLVGIRERAAAHGGTALVGPGPGGLGWSVHLRIPIASPEEVRG